MSNYPLDMHREAMLGFKQKLCEIVGVIGDYESIAYLDYPIHLNTGDLLIMRGTEAFFSHFGIKPKVRKSVAAQSRMDGKVEGIIEGSTTIVFHGGGNLGDLYPLHDNFRKLVIKRYPNNKIVILPQTIHFSSKKNLESASEIYRTHSNLHLCVRDRVSFKLASNYLSENVYLMPDMAHFLWPLAVPRVHEGSSKTLFLMRGDKESAEIPIEFRAEESSFRDWDGLRSGGDVFIETLCKKLCAIERTSNVALLPVTRIWYSFVENFITRQAKEFLKHRRVVTSRLHGHIFATLLDMPSTVIDNSYGKNRAYYEAWTSACGIAELR